MTKQQVTLLHSPSHAGKAGPGSSLTHSRTGIPTTALGDWCDPQVIDVRELVTPSPGPMHWKSKLPEFLKSPHNP